jgi:hypothetical protein
MSRSFLATNGKRDVQLFYNKIKRKLINRRSESF